MIRLASFFAGIGGLELGLEEALDAQTVFQCERDPYAQRVLEKHWPGVPRHDDITAVEPGAIPHADIWCGEFPCQDISLAGKGAGLGQLSEVGYDAEWSVLSAEDVGAPHLRRRVFLIAWQRAAVRDSDSEPACPVDAEASGVPGDPRPEQRRAVADADLGHGDAGQALRPGRDAAGDAAGDGGRYVAHAGSSRLEERQGAHRERPHAAASGASWWTTEPNVGRVADGVPSRVDRLRCLGNAVVPQCAFVVGLRLKEIMAS